MSKPFGFGGLFRKAPETHEEEAAAEAVRERLARESAANETTDDLDADFREALADGEITGDIVVIDAKGREVKGRKRSNIFDV